MIDFLWTNILKLKNNSKSVKKNLEQNFLFQDLTSWELHFVEDIVNVRTYRPSEVLFKQSDIGAGMYLIVSGKIQIQIEQYDAKTQSNHSHIVTELGPKDFFGELSLVENETRRNATAIATEDTVAISFFKADLMEIVKRNPQVGVKILLRLSEVLGERLRQTTAKLGEINRIKYFSNSESSK